MPEIELAQGRIRYRDEGGGPPIVFVHGALVDGRLWEPVVERLGDSRCIVPDLPLGAHSIAMRPDADVSPAGIARLIADLLEALDLRDVTLVGNDTGGGLCQLLVTRHPERVGRLVLTTATRSTTSRPRCSAGWWSPPGCGCSRHCCSRCACARCGGRRSPSAGW